MFKKLVKTSLLTFLALSASANANMLTLNLTSSINGATPLSTDKSPWLTATFSDVVLENGQSAVQLVMTNNLVNATTNVASGEYVADWLFNIDPSITSFTYAAVSGYRATVTTGAVEGGAAIKGGTFDIDFSGGTAKSSRFSGGMTSVYNFFGTGLTADSFAFTSDAGYYSAADVRGIPTGLSGSIGVKSLDTVATAASASESGSNSNSTSNSTSTSTSTNVPEPASLALLGLGMAALVGAQRRKKSNVEA